MGQNIKGKIAYVTGAGSGIGRATARELAKEGVHVGLIARTEEKLEKLANELKEYDVKVEYEAVDISDMDAVNKSIDQLRNRLGKADILINNAGVGSKGNLVDADPDEWKRPIEVNVFGTYYVTRAVLPDLIEKNKGDIINISSSNGLKATAGSSAYSASKFAVQGMSEALMQEVRPYNIRVFTMNPSLVATELVLEIN